MASNELRRKFLDFFEKRGHKIVSSSSLIPTDPSVLFTTAGMQQFKEYFLGKEYSEGKNVVSCQKCLRTSDIDEVGDESHLTFFEMLGNFSFGGYFKEEAIRLAHEFITEELKLKIDYVTVFSPEKVTDNDWRKGVKEDKESFEVWKKLGIPEGNIKKEGVDNFWGPTGEDGPCGPTTEIYINGVEIWNIVFNEFFCNKDKKLEKLKISGVDTGMGLERLAMVAQKKKTIFETDLFESIIKLLPDFDDRKKRIITDHAKAIVFLVSDGIKPSNKDQGYILRRLMRRVIGYHFLTLVSSKNFFTNLFNVIVEKYEGVYGKLDINYIIEIFDQEKRKFLETIDNGIKEHRKMKAVSAFDAFFLYQTHGLPFDMIKEISPEKSKNLTWDDFEKELSKHKELSRTASVGMFKGGLADEKPETIRLHTAHHLLLAALQQLFGKSVKQKGSNINSERLRMDFTFDRKITDKEKEKIEDIVNEKIRAGLSVVKMEMPRKEAEKIGAEMEFGVKYDENVSVYFIEDEKDNVFSKEFCGGPHVNNTSEIGHFKIVKEESVGVGVRRIRAIV